MPKMYHEVNSLVLLLTQKIIVLAIVPLLVGLRENIPILWETVQHSCFFFGGEGGHDTKRIGHNVTKNNCVLAFTNIKWYRQ